MRLFCLSPDIIFFQCFSAEPLPLTDICRRVIRQHLGKNRLQEIHRLPLPTSVKNYLLYQS